MGDISGYVWRAWRIDDIPMGYEQNMNVRLIADRVLIEPIDGETQMGFAIPEEYRTFRIGKVVAVGNGRRIKKTWQRIPIQIEVGSKVALSTDYRMPIEIDGKQYFLVSSEKVMAVIP